MRFRGLPAPSNEDIASAQEENRDREFAHWRRTRQAQLARRRQWLLDMESRYDEPAEYESSDDDDDDDDDPDPDTNQPLLATDDDEGGDESDGLQGSESVILPQGPVERVSSAETGQDADIAGEEDSGGEVPFTNTEGDHSTIVADHLQELRGNVVENAGGGGGDDDDVEFGGELQDMVQMVGRDDAESAEQGYQALRSDSMEDSGWRRGR